MSIGISRIDDSLLRRQAGSRVEMSNFRSPSIIEENGAPPRAEVMTLFTSAAATPQRLTRAARTPAPAPPRVSFFFVVCLARKKFLPGFFPFASRHCFHHVV